jgi:tellurite resistance protein TerC
MSNTWFWIIFATIITIVLAVDLGLFNRRQHEVKFKQALGWVGAWAALAFAFMGLLWFWHGHKLALEYLTAYIVEYSLSVDNIFVFLLVFSYFQVPPAYQHRVLFWGIIGAVILRAVMIFAGIALINMFHWVLYIFGALLILSAIKIIRSGDEKFEPERNPVLKLFRRLIPLSEHYDREFFLTKLDERLIATPLLAVLVIIETTDVVFALDSIPAVLGISKDPLVVYTSNIFAILGLRALYFVLAQVMQRFHLLSYGLAVGLAFIGVKMIIEDWGHISIMLSLGIVIGVLAAAVIASLLIQPKAGLADPPPEVAPSIPPVEH